jgi:hypothetical protein
MNKTKRTGMNDWKVNCGIKPTAQCVDIRFRGDDGLIEECHNEHPDEWAWSLDQLGGTITMYRIVKDSVDMSEKDESSLVEALV